MSESKLITIVKNGTTSTKYDVEVAKSKSESEERRKTQDNFINIAKKHKSINEVADIQSRNLTGPENHLVFHYMTKDGSIKDTCSSNLIAQPMEGRSDMDLMFDIVCPDCIARGIPQDQAQMLVRNSNRKFTFDERPQLMVTFDEGYLPIEQPVCGTISSEETIRCNNYNCTFACKIEDSKVWRV